MENILNYLPLGYLDFNIIAIIVIIGLIAAILGFGFFISGVHSNKIQEGTNIIMKKRKKSFMEKTVGKIYIEEDEFEVVEKEENEKQNLVEREDESDDDFDGTMDNYIQEIKMKDVEEKQLEKEDKKEEDISDEDAAFLEELKRSIAKEKPVLELENGKKDVEKDSDDETVNGDTTSNVQEKSEDEDKEEEENTLSLNMKERIKQYALKSQKNEE